MARILSIDYGTQKCGIAATDPLQIIVTPLNTLSTSELFNFLDHYIVAEEVVEIVIGMPSDQYENNIPLIEEIKKVGDKIKTKYNLPVNFEDEHLTSQEAKKIILLSGAKKKKRRDKALVDKISATLILQSYLGHI
jgi:putative Holliday junction resolvase